MNGPSSSRSRLRDRLNAARRCIMQRVAPYPFEVCMATLAMIGGLPVILGLARPASLVLLLPWWGYMIFGIALVLGALTVIFALSRRSPYPAPLATGLQLIGATLLIYGASIVIVAGWPLGWTTFITYEALGLISILRARYFKRLIVIAEGADRLRGET